MKRKLLKLPVKPLLTAASLAPAGEPSGAWGLKDREKELLHKKDGQVWSVPTPSVCFPLVPLQEPDVHSKPWYAGTCDRKTADEALTRSYKVSRRRSRRGERPRPGPDPCAACLCQDGAFLVRDSSGQDAQQPYTLVVFYNGRVYNIPVRSVAATRQYALGREKSGEEVG